MVEHNAYKNSPEYYEELDPKFEDSLADKEDGIEKIIKYLEVKFGVSQHSFPQVGDIEQPQDISAKLNPHYSAMLHTSEVYTSLEVQSAVKKAKEAKTYTDHIDIKFGEWVYYRTNVNRYWQGPIKVLAKDGKRLHCLKHGSAVVVNTDDVCCTNQR